MGLSLQQWLAALGLCESCVPLKGRSTSLIHAQAETHLARHWSWEFSWILFLLKKKSGFRKKKKKSELGLFGMGRCFVTRMFLRWGLSPSILASFLGLTRPSLGQQTGGGDGASASEIQQEAI